MNLKQWGQFDPNTPVNLNNNADSMKINRNSQLELENTGEIMLDQVPSNLHAPIINSSKSKYSASQHLFPYLNSMTPGSQNTLFANHHVKSSFMQSLAKNKVSIPGLSQGDFNLAAFEQPGNNNSFVLNTSGLYPNDGQPSRRSNFKNIELPQSNYNQKYEYFSELGKRDSIYSESKRMQPMNGNISHFPSNSLAFNKNKDFLDTDIMKSIIDCQLSNPNLISHQPSVTAANSRIALPNWNAQTETFEKPHEHIEKKQPRKSRKNNPAPSGDLPVKNGRVDPNANQGIPKGSGKLDSPCKKEKHIPVTKYVFEQEDDFDSESEAVKLPYEALRNSGLEELENSFKWSFCSEQLIEELSNDNKKKIKLNISEVPLRQLMNYIEALEKIPEKNYSCRICGQTFHKGSALGGHMAKMHKGESEKYKHRINCARNRKNERERNTFFKEKLKIIE